MESANTTNQDLTYCFTDPLDLKSGKTLITDYILKYEHPQPLHCETHTHTHKRTEKIFQYLKTMIVFNTEATCIVDK